VIEWGVVSTVGIGLVTVGGSMGGGAVFMVRHFLRASFATIDQLGAVLERLEKLERGISHMPSHLDIQSLGSRLGDVERGVAVAREAIDGVKAGMGRVEHMMGLLIEAGLDKEKAPRS
jgi:hypothetical protein